MSNSKKTPLPGAASGGAGLGEAFGERETKMPCPACRRHVTCATCRGAQIREFRETEAVGHYALVYCEACEGNGTTLGPASRACALCRGTGMVRASAASAWRMKNPTGPPEGKARR